MMINIFIIIMVRIKEDRDGETLLFSDRAIYRPGQTVYFKGIVYQRSTKNKYAAPIVNKKITVTLNDPNEDAVDSLSLTTNSYGSYFGKFTLPNNLLNGEFTITDEETYSELRIRVEEYKRPKFSVEISKPSGTYRVNDTINVTGYSKAHLQVITSMELLLITEL